MRVEYELGGSGDVEIPFRQNHEIGEKFQERWEKFRWLEGRNILFGEHEGNTIRTDDLFRQPTLDW